MPDKFGSVQVHSFLGLFLFVLLWIVLCECTHVLVMALRHEPLLGWAISPFGVTFMFLHEPSVLSIWLNVLCPALVSGGVLYAGLFTTLSPVTLPHYPLWDIVIMLCGMLITSTADLFHALRDLRYPLWGEARVLRTIQNLRVTWARIHFTSFGHTYLLDHFGSNLSDLLRAF